MPETVPSSVETQASGMPEVREVQMAQPESVQGSAEPVSEKLLETNPAVVDSLNPDDPDAVLTTLAGADTDQSAQQNLPQTDKSHLRADELPQYQDLTQREAVQKIYENQSDPGKRQTRYEVDEKTGKLKKVILNEIGADITEQVEAEEAAKKRAEEEKNTKKTSLKDRLANRLKGTEQSSEYTLLREEIAKLQESVARLELKIDNQTKKIESLENKVGASQVKTAEEIAVTTPKTTIPEITEVPEAQATQTSEDEITPLEDSVEAKTEEESERQKAIRAIRESFTLLENEYNTGKLSPKQQWLYNVLKGALGQTDLENGKATFTNSFKLEDGSTVSQEEGIPVNDVILFLRERAFQAERVGNQDEGKNLFDLANILETNSIGYYEADLLGRSNSIDDPKNKARIKQEAYFISQDEGRNTGDDLKNYSDAEKAIEKRREFHLPEEKPVEQDEGVQSEADTNISAEAQKRILDLETQLQQARLEVEGLKKSSVNAEKINDMANNETDPGKKKMLEALLAALIALGVIAAGPISSVIKE